MYVFMYGCMYVCMFVYVYVYVYVSQQKRLGPCDTHQQKLSMYYILCLTPPYATCLL